MNQYFIVILVAKQIKENLKQDIRAFQLASSSESFPSVLVLNVSRPNCGDYEVLMI
jgi:hypothetical protein